MPDFLLISAMVALPNMLNQLGILIHAGAPELSVEQVLAMFLNGTIVYGDPNCHHHCEGHHHE